MALKTSLIPACISIHLLTLISRGPGKRVASSTRTYQTTKSLTSDTSSPSTATANVTDSNIGKARESQ